MEKTSGLKAIWTNADCVCFDVDSTVVVDEGIDELAKFCNTTNVDELTKQAMTGKMTFQESLKARLDLIQPTRGDIERFLVQRPPNLTPHIQELVKLLHDRNIPVYLISGGFMSIITPIATSLNIPIDNVYANRLKFYYTGEYAGFDEEALTSRSGGKAAVVSLLKTKYGYKNLILIGDGITDLEACPPADAFIGFGGNVIRENVRQQAKYFINSFEILINLSTQQ